MHINLYPFPFTISNIKNPRNWEKEPNKVRIFNCSEHWSFVNLNPWNRNALLTHVWLLIFKHSHYSSTWCLEEARGFQLNKHLRQLQKFTFLQWGLEAADELCLILMQVKRRQSWWIINVGQGLYMNRIIHGWRGGSFLHSLILVLLHLDKIYRCKMLCWMST